MMPCAYNSFIPFRVCFPNSHELIIKEVIKNTAMKNKISMFVGKVLEGKLTRTQYVLQSTASYIMSFTLIPMPTGILTNNSSLIRKTGVSTFSNVVCLCKCLFYFNVLHLHFSANVVSDKCFYFFHFSLGLGYVNSLKCTLNFTL